MFISGCADYTPDKIITEIIASLPRVITAILEFIADTCLFVFAYVFDILGKHIVPLIPSAFFHVNLKDFYYVASIIAIFFTWILYLISLQTYTFFYDGVFSPATSILRLNIAIFIILLVPTVFGGFCLLFELIANMFLQINPPGDHNIITQLSDFGKFVQSTAGDSKLSSIKTAINISEDLYIRSISALIKIILCLLGIFFIFKILLLKGTQLIGLMLSFILAPFAAAGIAHKSLQGWFFNWFKHLCTLLLFSTIWAICLKLIIIASQYPYIIAGPGGVVNKTALFLSPFMVLGVLGIMTQVETFAGQILEGAGNVSSAANTSGGAMTGVIRSKPVQAIGRAAGGYLQKGAILASKIGAGVASGGTSVAAGAVAVSGSNIMSMAANKLGRSPVGGVTGGVSKYLRQHSQYSKSQLKNTINNVKKTGSNLKNNVDNARRAIGLTRQIPGQNGPVQTKDRNRGGKPPPGGRNT